MVLLKKFQHITTGIRRHAESGERAEVGRQNELQGVRHRHRHCEGKQQAEHGLRRQPVQHLPRPQLRPGERNRRLVQLVVRCALKLYTNTLKSISNKNIVTRNNLGNKLIGWL